MASFHPWNLWAVFWSSPKAKLLVLTVNECNQGCRWSFPKLWCRNQSYAWMLWTKATNAICCIQWMHQSYRTMADLERILNHNLLLKVESIRNVYPKRFLGSDLGHPLKYSTYAEDVFELDLKTLGLVLKTRPAERGIKHMLGERAVETGNQARKKFINHHLFLKKWSFKLPWLGFWIY